MNTYTDFLNKNLKGHCKIKMAWRDGLNFYAYFVGLVTIPDYHTVKTEAEKLMPGCKIFLNCL